MDATSAPYALAIGGACFLVLGIVLVYVGLKIRRRAIASASWPRAPGVVTSIDVHASRSSPTRPDAATQTTYHPKITYDYEVGGRRLTGSRLNFSGRHYYSHRKAAAQLDPFPVGEAIEVFYDPADPDMSTLSTATSGTWTLVILAGGMVFLGAFLLAFGLANLPSADDPFRTEPSRSDG